MLCFHLSDIQNWPAFSERAGPRFLWLECVPNEQSFVLVLTNTHMLKLKIKNFREQNFKGEANSKQLDSEDTQQSDFSS